MSEVVESAGSELARKITISTLTGGPSKWRETLMEKKSEPLKLCAIYGFATGYKAGATDLGEFIKFLGNFEGVNMMTGEIVRAPTVILPTFLAQAMASALDQEAPVVNGEKQPNTVRFAVEVHAVYDAKAAQMFVYKVIDRMPVQTDDPLRALRGQVAQSLGAPTNVAQITDASEKATGTGGKGKK